MSKRRVSQFLILSLAVLVTFLSVRFLIAQTKRNSDKSEKRTSASQSTQTVLSPKNLTPEQARDAVLGAEIDRIMSESDLGQARLGVFVISLQDGRVLYSRDGDRLFTPASNMKVYTTAVALDLLGADYRWRTSVYASKQPDANGVIDGDLTLYGRGAPDLISKPKGDAPSLAKFADQLYQSGVRQVRGNILGDESYFRGDLFGLGWQWNDLQWYFGAEPSALSVNENSIEVTIAPANKKGTSANVVVTPNESYVHLTNNATTTDGDAVTTIGVIRDLSTNDVRVWGDFPVAGRAFSAFLSVHNPALWAATLFKQALVARGITVDGEPRGRDFRVADKDKFDPQKSFELAYQDSERLGEIIRKTNKESNNLFAELILRTVGKERGSLAPDPDPRKNQARGDDQAGAAVVNAWLGQKGISPGGLEIRDGSGLSRLDLITPEVTARLLVTMAKSNGAATFHDSLPIAGHDGTLASRLKKYEGRIFAKTGSLTYVHALSGYANAPGGEVFAFSILCNDATTDPKALSVIDQIAGAIADFGQPTSQK
jgi:D-alanyl-D-alanine carboxypeptidase/D-alanyl-D-alanine-endopeptidase (penicillin-binding protein 4)